MSLAEIMDRLQRKMESHFFVPSGDRFWKTKPSLELGPVHELIKSRIVEGEPFCLARFGTVELRVILWGSGIPRGGLWGMPIAARYVDTRNGATNAGIRPRTKESYREFARIACDSSRLVDLLGKWNTWEEAAMIRATGINPQFCDVELPSPTMVVEPHWIDALGGKRVLVVSPFQATIAKQIPRLHRVWEKRGWDLNVDFVVRKFPYLIDDDSPYSWQEVYGKLRNEVSRGDYDVALFGCGGLGLPLAAEAKRAGKIGLHLGGHLQLLFGIYGQRHLEQPWHASAINESWVRPLPEDTARSAQRVEGGCYW